MMWLKGGGFFWTPGTGAGARSTYRKKRGKTERERYIEQPGGGFPRMVREDIQKAQYTDGIANIGVFGGDLRGNP